MRSRRRKATPDDFEVAYTTLLNHAGAEVNRFMGKQVPPISEEQVDAAVRELLRGASEPFQRWTSRRPSGRRLPRSTRRRG